ncbi:MAG: hypothetical protein AB1679_36415 [Actinomycetota bacterium]|jgi:hypothetical protein
MNDPPTRLTIVLDVDDPNPDLLFIWAGLRAAKLVDELWNNGIHADVVSLDIDGNCHYSR